MPLEETVPATFSVITPVPTLLEESGEKLTLRKPSAGAVKGLDIEVQPENLTLLPIK